ncbi:hypothetical protein ABUE34_16030 (plasmid) [Kozakia baliensis]|uniref:hypothetical protein n=1 Tax=Kozakia baliensis TaxID=153496 RepID=UPI00345C43BF
MPWQATYNRIFLLKEMLDRNVTGWVFYLDADSYIEDIGFDLDKYLEDKDKYAAIFAGDHTVPYHINAGGFAINFSHVLGRRLVLDYWQAIENISEVDFNNAAIWGKQIAEDQLILFEILKKYYVDLNIGNFFLFEKANQSFVNHGPFIKQHLRSRAADFSTRLKDIETCTSEIVAGESCLWTNDGPGYFFTVEHPRIKTHVGKRRTNKIESVGVAGALIYGPYINIRKGNYIVRVLGKIPKSFDAENTGITIRITSDIGTRVIYESSLCNNQDDSPIIMEHYFSIIDDVSNLETCILVGEQKGIEIQAVQINWTDQWIDED